MKTCTKCGETKPEEHFSRFCHAADGRSPHCKSCRSADHKARYASKHDEIRAQQSEYNASNRKRIRSQQAEYRERNSEALIVKRREEYQRNRDRYRATNEEWKARNPERHRFLIRRSHLKITYSMTPDQYDALLLAQDGRCAICSRETGERLLHVDHDHVCCPGQRSCGACVRGLLCGGCNRLLGWFEKKRDAIESYVSTYEVSR
jgi:hypothetical protein